MCEILVRVKTNGPVGKHYQLGDPVVCMPDGYTWGIGELNADNFAVVYLPELSLEDGRALCQEIDDAEGNMTRRRRYNFTPFVKSGEQQPATKLLERLVDYGN